jgi:hypothetical protein
MLEINKGARAMKNTLSIFAIATVMTLFQGSPAMASNHTSPDGKYSFQLETDGYSLPTWYWNGYTFVEGRRGQRYNIRVTNHSPRRVEAVVTVDGRDAISGQLGDYRKNRGYVIEPWGSVLIRGFRTSWSDVAGFYFTDIENSYSARMGSSAHVGVIGVAVFEEKSRQKPRRPIHIAPAPKKRGLGTGYGNSAPADHTEESAQSYNADGAPARERSRNSHGASSAPAPRQNIGTGYGDREYSPATSTEFRRSSRRPAARLAIYYDDRASLIEQGIIPQPRPIPHRQPNPFPRNSDPGFAPPPPAYYWE